MASERKNSKVIKTMGDWGGRLLFLYKIHTLTKDYSFYYMLIHIRQDPYTHIFI
jgi:hypothetical protein